MAENIKCDRAIRPSELMQILGISRSSVHRLEASNALPRKRRFLGGSSTFYMLSEILEFLKNQPQVDIKNKKTLQDS